MMSFLGSSTKEDEDALSQLADPPCLTSSDRINIGVAKLNGLEKELGLSSLQYSIASLVFFATYVLLLWSWSGCGTPWSSPSVSPSVMSFSRASFPPLVLDLAAERL